MDSTMSDTAELEYLILDAGAIIKGHGLELFKSAKIVVTVPEVLGEIRDSKARDMLQRLPYELQERIPSTEAIRKVAEYAKKTGDFAALSKTDLRLIALTYMLEVELCGLTHLKDLSLASSLQGKVKVAPAPAPAPIPKAPAPVSSNAPRGSLFDQLESSEKFDEETVAEMLSKVDLNGPDSDAEEEEDSGAEEEDSEEEEKEGEESGAVVIESGSVDEVKETETEKEKGDNNIASDIASDLTIQNLDDYPALDGRAAPAAVVASSSWITILRKKQDPSASASAGSVGKTPLVYAQKSIFEQKKKSTSKPVVSAGNPSEPISAAVLEMKQNENLHDHNHHDHSCCSHSHHDEEKVKGGDTEASSPVTELKTVTVNPNPNPNPKSNGKLSTPSAILSRHSGQMNSESTNARAALEDDGEGWINSTNMRNHLSQNGSSLGVSVASTGKGTGRNRSKKGKAKAKIARVNKVACITTDFAMQNVLMQIGLNIMSVDGLLIRAVKQWVLRCNACTQVHYDMDRLFCTKCGNSYLSRVSASIDNESGELKLHLRKNYHHELRGTKYSLPAPGKQDRFSGELLLREDQLLGGIWRQKCVKIRKDVKSVFGEDVTSDVGMHVNKGQQIKIGLGGRNPNAAKGRERRGKAKK